MKFLRGDAGVNLGSRSGVRPRANSHSAITRSAQHSCIAPGSTRGAAWPSTARRSIPGTARGPLAPRRRARRPAAAHDGALRIIDRGLILDATRQALDLHQWLTASDFD
jgi:hypothetical protein